MLDPVVYRALADALEIPIHKVREIAEAAKQEQAVAASSETATQTTAYCVSTNTQSTEERKHKLREELNILVSVSPMKSNRKKTTTTTTTTNTTTTTTTTGLTAPTNSAIAPTTTSSTEATKTNMIFSYTGKLSWDVIGSLEDNQDEEPELWDPLGELSRKIPEQVEHFAYYDTLFSRILPKFSELMSLGASEQDFWNILTYVSHMGMLFFLFTCFRWLF